jgi:hypothetical protein
VAQLVAMVLIAGSVGMLACICSGVLIIAARIGLDSCALAESPAGNKASPFKCRRSSAVA